MVIIKMILRNRLLTELNENNKEEKQDEEKAQYIVIKK